MSKEETIISLDIGSNSIHGVIAQYDTNLNKIDVLSAKTVPAPTGIKDGVVIGIEEATNAVSTLISYLEKDLDQKATIILTAIRGGLVSVFSDKADIRMPENDMEVRQDTINELQDKIRNSRLLDDKHEIVEIIPKEYIIDRQEGIYNPIGMPCKDLELHALIVAVTQSNIANIRKSVEYDTDLFYGYTCLGEMLVPEEDKESGCILMDIGATTTGIVVYSDKKIQTAFELNCGSDLITRDIVKKLRVSQKTAKEIKEQYGAIFVEESEDETFEYKSVGTNNQTQTYTKKQLSEIIALEVDYIIDNIHDKFKKSNIEIDMLSGGIILTGAGSKLPGMAKAIEQGFNCVAKIVNFNEEENIIVKDDILDSQVYTTAISVLLKGYKTNNSVKKSRKSSIFGKIKKFIDESF